MQRLFLFFLGCGSGRSRWVLQVETTAELGRIEEGYTRVNDLEEYFYEIECESVEKLTVEYS
jgi:hypothetical protein